MDIARVNFRLAFIILVCILSRKKMQWDSFQFPVSAFFEGGKLEISLGPEPDKQLGIGR